MITRGLGWLQRFVTCWRVLGLRNAIVVFLGGRYSNRMQSVLLPNGLKFHFRGKFDAGVVSHFYTNLFFIEDVPEKRISTVLDCGANIGDETARFLYHYPDALIVAAEAELENFRVLQQNFGNEQRVTLLHVGIWPTETRLNVIKGSTMESSRVALAFAGDEDTITAMSIPSIMRRMGWNQIDILKLDIEGAEQMLFATDSEDWIDKVNVIIFEVCDSDAPGCTQTIFRALDNLQFNTFVSSEKLVLIKADQPWKLRSVFGFKSSQSGISHFM